MTITEEQTMTEISTEDALPWVEVARGLADTLAGTAADHDRTGDFQHEAFRLVRRQ